MKKKVVKYKKNFEKERKKDDEHECLISLDSCFVIHLVGSEFGIKNMKPWIHPLHTFGPLLSIRLLSNTTAYLRLLTDSVHHS